MLASLGFAAIGVIVIPPILYFGEEVASLAFGEQYRAAAAAIDWLVPGAWIFYAVTGWSAIFGSVANARMTVIAFYVMQIALFAAVALAMGGSHQSLALALASSQVLVALGFWGLFLVRPAALRASA